MIYVYDTSGFRALFRSFYRGRFPTLWGMFDDMVADGRIISTREVKREIEDQDDDLNNWANQHVDVFHTPTAEVAGFLRQIYDVRHFQANIEQKKLLKGGKNADPFLIATAAVHNPPATVVTLEAEKPGAAKIPNICRHFGIPCVDLEGFMEAEEWIF